MLLHIYIIVTSAILGFFLSKLFINIIEKFPNYLYKTWAKHGLEILSLKSIPDLESLDTNITHKKCFMGTTILLFIMTTFLTTPILQILAYLMFISIILILIVIDYKTMLLPDELTLPLIALGLLFNLNGLIAGSLENAVYGAVAGYMILWTVFWVFKLLTKKDGMGYGDFKLLSAILAFLGIQNLLAMLILSSAFGLIYIVIMSLYNKLFSHKINFKNDGAIPFGPYLGLAGIILLLFGNSINILQIFAIY